VIAGLYRRGMSLPLDASFRPDPEDPIDVLAFVLCPPAAFAPAGDEDELEAVAQVIRPMKAEAIRRWADLTAARRRS
jgi:hypothetical protein